MAVLKEGVIGGAMNLYFIYKFLRILTTPFASTDAFKLGIIDEKGKILKKKSKLKTIEEKEAYTMFDRLVWKLKRLMEKIPFGKTRLASYAAALWLIKEENNFNGTDKELQESFLDFLETDWKNEALILKENYEGDMDKKSFRSLKEGIDIKKASMKIEEGLRINLKKLKKQYDKNEDENKHTENYLLLAKAFGTPAEVKNVEIILAKNQMRGYTSKTDDDWMYKNLNKYYNKIRNEGIDIEKASMGAVIKDFQNSDAPQFKGKSDKKRREMAIAAKLSKEENEDDDPVGKSKKNSKKDKVNLKPKMDETMKNYKEFMKNVKETRSQTQEKTGDEAEYQEKRKEVLKKFGVESCSQCETEKEKKACYKALDDAHVADHEEQVKKEEVEVSENTKEYKDVVSKILGRRKEVKEAVTTGGIEYGEQDWDVQHRLENSYPNLHANYAEFHEQGLEGPYLWHGETYFFDRKVGGWYSVTEEDFVDDEISKDLSLAYVKDGMYKRQFAS